MVSVLQITSVKWAVSQVNLLTIKPGRLMYTRQIFIGRMNEISETTNIYSTAISKLNLVSMLGINIEGLSGFLANILS